ncbi:MAG TPA: histidinol-phosphatase [Solirubrobacteraceae bacterium]
MAVPADDLVLALELADAADAITMARFRAEDLVVETKPDLTPVSEADREVEQAMRSRLSEARPADAVIGEEYGGDGSALAASGRRWIVDPIDGTKSYVRGVPVWATLLALEERGELILGVVSAPALSRRWWAVRGSGAFVADGFNGAQPRRLRVSAVHELEDAQLCFGGFEEWRGAGRLEGLVELSARCWRTRGYGDFWQYMLVAEGALEISMDPEVSLWDLAAPMVVVQEAGGRLTDLSGEATAAGGDALASNGLLHEAARAYVSR